jgi:hypothetical protein
MRGDNFKEGKVMDEKSLPTTQSGARLRHRYLRPLTPLTQQIQIHRRRLASSAIVLMLAGLFLAPLAFAKVAFNTIDPVATVTDHGRLVIATGPLTCTRGERAFLRVTVT